MTSTCRTARPSAPTVTNAVGTAYGVDFSGARLAGRSIWVAKLEPAGGDGPPYVLSGLGRLEKICGTAERSEALAALVSLIAGSRGCLWGLGFPFAFPFEVAGPWPEQLELVRSWGDDAFGLSLELVRRTERLFGRKHLKRLTDREHRAPHDPYHYRVIYQTFFGMRDVLRPLLEVPGTTVLPFGYNDLRGPDRIVVEACPATTLDNLGLPRWNYKSPRAERLEQKRLSVRRKILCGLAGQVAFSEHRRRVMASDPGGDALDAVLAALGAASSFAQVDHDAVAAHPRYTLEGRHFA